MMGAGERFRAWGTAAILAGSVVAAAAARADWFVDDPGFPAEACEPYALVEALAMQRAPGAGGPLAFNTTTDLPVIAADSLQFAMAPGLRAVYGRHGPCALGWEVGYVGVWGMVANQAVAGDTNLDVPPLLNGEVGGLRNASVAQAKYTSGFDSVEANVLFTRQNWKEARVSAYAHDDSTRIITWDWLAGFRWAGLTEAAALTMTQPGGLADTYAVRTGNNLFAGQIGFKGRADWGAWALDGWLKAGLAGTALSQAQAPIVDYTGDVFRQGRFTRSADVGGIFDIDIALSRRIAENWAIRAGWNSIWLTGVALATNQFDFATGPTAGTGVANGGTFWINGLTLGLEGRW